MSSTRKGGKCPACGGALREVLVSIAGARQKALSLQCRTCDYFSFEQGTAKKVVKELSETPLRMRQRIIKLSQDRLGIYLNQHVVRSLALRNGAEVDISVPDRKHIVIELK